MVGPGMIRHFLVVVLFAGTAHAVARQPVASETGGASAEASVRREAFLKRADAAFATRDPASIAALAELDAWRAAGYPELTALHLFLPPAPLVLEKELTPLESVWRDGNGRRWRLVLREVKGELKAVVRAIPCPRGIATAPGVERPERPTPKAETWSLLECWPLPK